MPTERRAPFEVADLTLTTVVSNAVVTGDLVVRMSADWWTSSPQLEIAPAADPGRTEPIGKLDLAALSQGDDQERLLRAMGAEIANLHLAGPTADVGRDLKGRRRRWLLQAAERMAEVTVADWKAWKRR